MTALRGDFAVLLCVSLLRVTLEALMPEGGVKRYARFVFGVVTMALLLRPVLRLLEYLAEG